MRKFPLAIVLLAALPAASFAQKQEIREVQRDVASLQDQVRGLERTLNENVGRLTAMLQQVSDAVNKVNTNLAVLDATMRDRDKNVNAPVASMGTKVDAMANEFQGLRVTMEDMNARLGKLQQSIVDLGNTVKVMQSPPTPPPGAGSPTSGPGMAAGGAPPAGMTAEALYANAMRDKDGGAYDSALAEFNDYLRYYGTTDLAPNAQYYIGEIYYNRKDYDNALKAFDTVLERFPDNNKTLDAMYMKGRSLVQMGERTKGAAEFRAVIQRNPRSDTAAKARDQLKALGLPATTSTPKRASRRR